MSASGSTSVSASEGSVGSTTSSNPASGAPIALKVRTLDQKTYPIVIGSDASVLQLKEVVAEETGVVFARQRLIFRGKVLKNDQNIAAYALEDGHVLHLVVRAEAPAPDTGNGVSGATATNAGDGVSGGRGGAAPNGATDRNANDEPDPMVGASPRNRVVMGATIAVPDDMPMPFLSSVIANFVNTVGHAANGNATAPGAAGPPPGLQGDELQRRLRNRDSVRRLRRRSRDGSDATGRGGPGISSVPLGGAMLRDFTENHLRRVGNALSNRGYEFHQLAQQDLDMENDGDEALIQEHLRQLIDQIQRFGPRLELLPVALRDIGQMGREGREAPNRLVTSTVGAIDTLQSIGDAASALARFSRHVFLENSPDLPSPIFRYDDRGSFRASLSFPTVALQPPTSAGEVNASSSTSSQSSSSTSTTGGSPGSTNGGSGGMLQSLYQRVTSGLMGTGSRTATTPASGPESVSQGSTTTQTATSVAPGPSRFTISTLSGPFHPAFPLPGIGGGLVSTDREQRPEWDIERFWSRLVGNTSASSVFGVLRGDPTSVHELMAFVGSIVIRGSYMPPLTRSGVRSWSRRFVLAVRRVLLEQTIPAAILDLTPDRDASRLIDVVTRPLGSFMPELVDHLIRANSASRGDVFGRSSSVFLRHVATHFVGQMNVHLGNDDVRLQRLFQAILETLGLESGLATYVIQIFLTWATPADRPRRRREEGGESPPSGAEVKRRREE